MFHVRFGKGTENTVLWVTKALKITRYLNVKDQHKICIFVLSICQGTVECGGQIFIGQTVFRDSSRVNHLCSTHSMNLEHVGRSKSLMFSAGYIQFLTDLDWKD